MTSDKDENKKPIDSLAVRRMDKSPLNETRGRQQKGKRGDRKTPNRWRNMVYELKGRYTSLDDDDDDDAKLLSTHISSYTSNRPSDSKVLTASTS